MGRGMTEAGGGGAGRAAPRWLALLRAAGPVDLRNVARDDLLAWVAAAPFLLALLMRFGVPPLAGLLERRLGFDLSPYHPLLASLLLLLAPTMVGMVSGFLLLDERDGGVLEALLVTPTPLGGYLAYRLGAPLVVGTVLTAAAYPLAGLAPLRLPDLVAVSLLSALNAPLTALLLAAFAENKVAGFALVKVLNTVAMLPLAAWFLRPPWQLAAGVVPAFWPMKAAWSAAAGESWAPYAVAGVAVYTAAILLLLRRLDRRLHG